MKQDNRGWTDERVARLKSLWAEGLSASQIARRLGNTTKNAVIGKINRLGLISSRPKTPTPRNGGMENLKESSCRWPIGHPGESDFHYCEKKAEPSRPYCLEHCDMSYQPKNEKEKADRVARKLAGIAVAGS
ncbi:MAG: GcrA family cell cycle regulator [Patescibacteria group bacterium]